MLESQKEEVIGRMIANERITAGQIVSVGVVFTRLNIELIMH